MNSRGDDKISRTYLFRTGPSQLLLAFNHHLGDPKIQSLELAIIYHDEAGLDAALNSTGAQQHNAFVGALGRFKGRVNPSKQFDPSQHTVPTASKEQMDVLTKLKQQPSLGYPVVLVGKQNITDDTVKLLESIGYKEFMTTY